jgi:hypothetical protein
MAFTAANTKHTVSRIANHNAADILNHTIQPKKLEQNLAAQTPPEFSHPVLNVKIP